MWSYHAGRGDENNMTAKDVQSFLYVVNTKQLEKRYLLSRLESMQIVVISVWKCDDAKF